MIEIRSLEGITRECPRCESIQEVEVDIEAVSVDGNGNHEYGEKPNCYIDIDFTCENCGYRWTAESRTLYVW